MSMDIVEATLEDTSLAAQVIAEVVKEERQFMN